MADAEWLDDAIRGVGGVVIFVVVFALARLRWKGDSDEQGQDSGLD